MLSSTVQAEAAAPYHLYAMDNADAIGQAGAEGQGPFLVLYARFLGDIVEEASFRTYTCPNAIACGSWVTRWMEGRTPDVLSRLTAADLITVLGGLPLGKEHCAALVVTALQQVIQEMNT